MSESEMFEDAAQLNLNLKATSQGMVCLFVSQKGKEIDFFLESAEGTHLQLLWFYPAKSFRT